MAYMYKDPTGEWGGPYPNKVGDSCGNGILGSPEFLGNKKGFRTGRPASCEGGTSEEMARKGYAGIYLSVDRPPSPDDIDVDTDMLTEPVVTGDREPERPFHKEEWVQAHS